MAFGPTQLLIVLAIILLLFGAKKIPELARGLGTGMSEFRKGASGEIEDKDSDGGESKADEEVSSASHDDSGSDEKLTYTSDENQKYQSSDEASKTEQRS